MFVTYLLIACCVCQHLGNSLALQRTLNGNNWNTLMAIKCYTRQDLLALRLPKVNYKLCNSVFATVKNYGILKPTARGPKDTL